MPIGGQLSVAVDTLRRSRDVGRALIGWFGHERVEFPYVPDFALDDLRVFERRTLATRAFDDLDLYLFHSAAESLVSGPSASAYALSYAGHGVNSYAWTLFLQRPGLRMLVQVPYGGALNDRQREVEELNEMFSIAREVDAMVEVGRDPEVVVLQSSLRDTRSTGFVPVSGSPQSPTELLARDDGHPIRVVEEICAYDAVQRETRAERVTRQARIMDEWAQRWPAAAEGSEDDPQADLELALRMEEPVLAFASHRWFPARVGDMICAWCKRAQSDARHTGVVASASSTKSGVTVTPDVAALVGFGCPMPLIDLLSDLPPDTVWTARRSGGQGEFYILSADDDAEGAIYIDQRHLMVALDPEDARALMAVIDSRVEQRNPTTWRVQVTAADIEDLAKRGRVIDALALSLRRSAQRAARSVGSHGHRRDESLECCPVCQQVLPATGICDDHGRPPPGEPA